MSNYANGFSLNINEVVFLQFLLNTNGQTTNVANIVLLYDALKQIHAAIGQTIEDHDAKLAKIAKAN